MRRRKNINFRDLNEILKTRWSAMIKKISVSLKYVVRASIFDSYLWGKNMLRKVRPLTRSQYGISMD